MLRIEGFVFEQYPGPQSPEAARWDFLTPTELRWENGQPMCDIVERRPDKDAGDMALHMDWQEPWHLYDRIFQTKE